MKKKPPIRISVAHGTRSASWNVGDSFHNLGFKTSDFARGRLTNETWFDPDTKKGELAEYLGESLHTYLRYRWRWIGLRVAWFTFTLLCAFSLAALLSA